MNELQPEGTLTCLVAKASLDESIKWHRRMAHVNFKNINKLAKNGLVKGLPSKIFSNEHNCVACNKGKQHKASYKAITVVSTITEPLQLLHMDLFGPTSIRSIDHKYYCLVVTDDFSRFCWAFFLGTKDETFHTLKDFITFIENQLNLKVKAIRCDNGTEFKNSKLIELCGQKGIRRDYSNARTPQQNGVAERKNRTLIEAARTMLADSKLPTMFWTEAVSTACYVLNRVLVTSPHIKTPYELLSGKVPNISHFKPFGCQVTILNTSEHSGKFDGKADEGFIVGYAANSKVYRVYNLSSKKVEETLNLRYLEDKPNIQGAGHEWILTLMQVKDTSGMKMTDLGYAEELTMLQRQEHEAKDAAEQFGFKFTTNTKELLRQATIEAYRNLDPAGSVPFPAGSEPVHAAHTPLPPAYFTRYPTPSDLGNSLSLCSELEDIHHHPSIGIFSSSSYDADFSADANNLLFRQEVRLFTLSVCLFLSQLEPSSVAQALNDSDWVEAMQEEMQQFINQKVRKLVPLSNGKTAIRTKWILKNKRDARGIVVKNKARLVAQGHRQEEGINYDEVFAPIARIEAIRLFLAFASYMGFMVYQMDVKSAFLYREIDEEVYVTQPKGFEDPYFPKHVYKVVKALYGLHQAPRAWFA
ncbi:putative ribonuclease H-like domain-containing protein [Tanacetum coccineum]